MHVINRSSGGMMEAVMVDFGGGLAYSFACSSLVCFLGWWMLACYGLRGLKTMLAASLWFWWAVACVMVVRPWGE